MRTIFIIIILSVFTGFFISCNSTGIPITPPGQDDNQQHNLPGPPPPPGQTEYGDTDPIRISVARDREMGKVPFQVTFTPEVTGGVLPYIFKWDFDSDGITDAVDEIVSPNYVAPGIYFVTLTIEDDSGAQAVEVFEIEALTPTPNPVIKAIPSEGPAPLNVNFIAQDSTPQAGASIVEYRWDFDDDGVWDFITTEGNGNTAWTFNEPGNYYPVLRIYDNLGFWEETSTHILVKF